jgi:hypothetical protein
MHTIDIDFEVFKALTARRASEAISYNDVVRDLLKLEKKHTAPPDTLSGSAAGDWVSKGVRFPAGTDFRAPHKGRVFVGRAEGGAMVVNGKSFDSPSAAATSITGNPVNGWTFWECRFPGTSLWQTLKSLRK